MTQVAASARATANSPGSSAAQRTSAQMTCRAGLQVSVVSINLEINAF
jgi:hypothetical protein